MQTNELGTVGVCVWFQEWNKLLFVGWFGNCLQYVLLDSE